MSSPACEIRNLTIEHPGFLLDIPEWTVGAGEYVLLTGKSGSGKTLFLEVLCGLSTARQGLIRLEGKDVTHFDPADRGIGYVPQDGALFPRMTVREHLGFSLEVKGFTKDETQERVNALGDSLKIAHLMDRRPVDGGLSGGECQRVALGRALARPPKLLLLDEPLAALDEDSRMDLREVLAQLHEETRCTVLHVSHNPSEMADLATSRVRFDAGGIHDGQ